MALFGSSLTSRYTGALPGALQAAKVPAPVRGGIPHGNGVAVNAAGRLLPGLRRSDGRCRTAPIRRS